MDPWLLHVAARDGRASDVATLLSLRYDVNRRTEQHGNSPLLLACLAGHAECARLLLAAGASTELVSANGTSPLHAACRDRGHPECARLLLEARAYADVADSAGVTPLLDASFCGAAGCARLLLAHGADAARATVDGRTPVDLILALPEARAEHGQILELLLRRPPRAPEPTAATDASCRRPCLQTTGRAGCRADFRARRGGCRGGRPPPSRRPLDRQRSEVHMAAMLGDAAALERLLAAGAPADDPTVAADETALHLACENGRLAAVALLLERGASLTARDQHGDTPLHLARHPEVVRRLLAGGAPVVAANRAGDHPIHAAAWGGDVRALALLIASGAAAEARGAGGETALDVAAIRCNVEAVRYLAQRAGIDAAVALRRGGARGGGGEAGADGRVVQAAAAASSAVSPRGRRAAARRQGLTTAWCKRAAAMPPLAARLLVGGAAPSEVAARGLLLEGATCDTLTKWRIGLAALEHDAAAAVLRVPSAVGADGCAALRRAVDTRGAARVDSVDGLPNRDLPLTADELEAEIGPAAARALLALPARFLPSCRVAISGIFARRYAAAGGEQPWTSFHFDNAAVTVNVALTDDADLAGGGRLLGVYGGAVHAIERAEGDATVHKASLLHAVARVPGEAVRYSLILFFARAG